MFPWTAPRQEELSAKLHAMVGEAAFPCVGAKAALARGQLRTIVCRDLSSAWDDLRIYSGLFQLAQSYSRTPTLFQSLVVLFEQPTNLSEREFESALWIRVQSLSEKDAAHGRGQRLDGQRLGQARHPFDQQVPLRQDGHEHALEKAVLADHDLLDLVQDALHQRSDFCAG